MRSAIVRILIGALSLTFLTNPPSAAAANSGSQVFLKLNQYHILHTHPVAPFIDPTGHLMVPIPIVPELMGLTVTVDSTGRQVTLSYRETSLHLSVGSSIGEIRYGPSTGQPPRRVEVTPAPKLHEPSGRLLVPIKVLLEAFGFRASWDPGLRILLVRDPRIMNPQPSNWILAGFEEQLMKTNTVETEDLVPVSFSFERVRDPDLRQFELRLVLRNTSRREIPFGRQALYTLVVYESGVASWGGRDIYVSAELGRTPDPCVKTSRTIFTCVAQFPAYDPASGTDEGSLRYIAARIRVRR